MMDIENIEKYWDNLRIKIREILNLYLGKYRSKKLKNPQFTIISNNCWGGHVYRYFNLPYDSPTIGLYMYANDYIKFIYHLREYISCNIQFIKYTESKYRDDIVKNHQEHVPIGILNDVEIMFLHYHSENEALEKWNRRKDRIHWDNLFFKLSEQNSCSKQDLYAFDNLSTTKKIVFVSEDYGLSSQIILKKWKGHGGVLNDTTDFRKFINITNWLNCEPFKIHQ